MTLVQSEYKNFMYRVLDTKVIAVAVVTKGTDDWSAYIGAVEGKHHDSEWRKVAEKGSKITHDLARILFPDFNRKYTWRD